MGSGPMPQKYRTGWKQKYGVRVLNELGCRPKKKKGGLRVKHKLGLDF